MTEYKALFVPDNYYHVFNRAVGNEKIFLTEDNYRYFLQQFRKYTKPVADTFCYCLLPNHFHFFIRIRGIHDVRKHIELLEYRHANKEDVISAFLIQQFSNFFNAYTKAFNRQQKRKGKLFMEPFNRRSITTSEYYTKLVHYIHANPVHHGFCKRVEEWSYSSYHEILQVGDSWLTIEEVIRWFGTTAAFEKFHQQPIVRKFV